jgi:hypothetical protein
MGGQDNPHRVAGGRLHSLCISGYVPHSRRFCFTQGNAQVHWQFGTPLADSNIEGTVDLPSVSKAW